MAEILNYDISKLNNSLSNGSELSSIIKNGKYYVRPGGEYLFDINSKFSETGIYVNDQYLKNKYKYNRKKIPEGYLLQLSGHVGYSEINSAFSFKWVDDFNQDEKLTISEFRHVKRNFFDNENFQIAIAYELQEDVNAEILVDLINDYSGVRVLSLKKERLKQGQRIIFFTISAGQLTKGKYLVDIKIIDRERDVLLSRIFEKILILYGNEDTKEVPADEIKYKEDYLTRSTPQGIFFCTSWTDKNNNNKYEVDEFNGLNKNYYSLSTDTIFVSFNFIDYNGEIIVQTWTKNDQLLGTSTRRYQKILDSVIYPTEDSQLIQNYLDMIIFNGPGEYKITVSFVEGKTFETMLIISE